MKITILLKKDKFDEYNSTVDEYVKKNTMIE